MIPYYADEQKYFLNTKSPVTLYRTDKAADQVVHITGSIFGIEIRPGIRWTPLCEKLFRQTGANAVRLEEISSAPDGSLAFINDLTGCKQLAIDRGVNIDLSPLAGNPHLEDLQLGPSARPKVFDLATLPSLRRCEISLCPELGSFLNCPQLVCLWLGGGQYDGVLKLKSLSALEEFICIDVKKLAGVILHSKVRLRSLRLACLRDFESVEPLTAITQELRVVELNKVPRMKLEWLNKAEKAECISLRLGEIPSIKFLSRLKRLQVLDLFGSKVKDGDLSFRDSLKGKLDPKLWGLRRQSA